ncbi:GTPase [Marinobacter sp. X15-166B]|uniref:GTPase n=1 Tax=Marinobacter sp. X15-166B TaxID=1897620 RepID=UPI00085BB420|nr:GTPase [Marinobacter sp. X15-166B]OEY65256.1 GTPase [Marinobacter sp. X15-166B]
MILKPDLTVPEQRTASLSYCDTSPKAFKGWVQSLPIANIGEASRQLYHAVIELNQLIIAPQLRLQFLDLLRPKIHFVCSELSRHYFGHSVSLPEKPRKIANLSQALQLHLANGYKLCVLGFIDKGGLHRNRKALATSCHRAISELGATIVRSYQLYCPSPAHSWLECHRLYRFAQGNRLAHYAVEDTALPARKASQVGECYKRVALLGCVRPNQLRQDELALVYDLLDSWSQHLQCEGDVRTSSLFVIDTERDGPPIYRSLVAAQQLGANHFSLDTQQLADKIASRAPAKGRRTRQDEDLAIPSGVSDVLLAHLSQALGPLAERNFNRTDSQGTLEICVGLTAVHYFIADERTFSQFVAGNEEQDDEENIFITASRHNADVWAGAHDTDQREDRLYSANTPITFRNRHGGALASPGDKHTPKAYRASLSNSSPGGYGLAWEGNTPAALQAGEVVGVRESSTHPWSVAVVRWLRQIRGQGTQVGIELLAPSAAPAAVRLIQITGNGSEYLRGLLLPVTTAGSQQATLITPRLPFQAGSRISLMHDEREDDGQLTRKVLATGSISQFELTLQSASHRMEPAPRSPAQAVNSPNEDEFDSLWPSL